MSALLYILFLLGIPVILIIILKVVSFFILKLVLIVEIELKFFQIYFNY